MNPFFNQIHGRGTPSNPPLQQAMPFNPTHFPQLPIPCPSPAFANPQNPQPVNMAAQFGAMQQNMHNALQNQQVLALVQQNLNQIVGLLNGQICPPNPALVPPFNSGIVGNHHGGLGVRSSSFGSGGSGGAGGVLQGKNQEMQSFSAVHGGGRSGVIEFSGPSRMSGSPMSGSPMKGQHGRGRMMHQNGGRYQPQVLPVKDGGSGVLNIESSSNNNFTKGFHRSREREATQMRFQKSQTHHGKHAKGGIRPFAKSGGPGQHNWKERNHQFNKGSKQAPVERKRPIPVNYTENEIKAWREARKKNFPTNANIAKKLAGNAKILEGTDGDAKLRRQQLKEILAQQAELGVEVAEIPSSYLSDSEILVSNSKGDTKDFRHGRKSWNARGKLRRNDNKRRNNHYQDKPCGKRPKLANDDTLKNPTNKREPTLLQKLLSKEIKKDKSKLLQVFRFMVMNSFFEHWPEKPLEFPVITIKDSDSKTVAAVETDTLLNGLESTPASGQNKNERIDELDPAVDDIESGPRDDCESDGDNDGSASFSIGEDDQNEDLHEKLEEGEITE
ncbi:putative nuclear fragile X mental retardation-interacting protein [Dioscorea sansibarensis]